QRERARPALIAREGHPLDPQALGQLLLRHPTRQPHRAELRTNRTVDRRLARPAIALTISMIGHSRLCCIGGTASRSFGNSCRALAWIQATAASYLLEGSSS